MQRRIEPALRGVLAAAYDGADGLRSGTLLAELRRAVGCDTVSLMEIGADGQLRAHLECPSVQIGDEAAYARAFGAHLRSCVFCASPVRVADRYGVAAMADVYPRPDQHATAPGADYFRLFATNRALAVDVADDRGQERALLALCRSGRAFSDRDRLLLGLLRPHLQAAYRAELARRTANRLTSRQREILDLVAAGHTNPEIAARLVLSVGTVRKHLDNVYARLGVSSRFVAAARVRSSDPVGGPAR